MMKTSRNEQIVTTVGHYLKRRQYLDVTDTNMKKAEPNLYNVKEMALSCSVLNCWSAGMSVSFSSVIGDATVWDQQYTRMKNFIAEAATPFRSELSALLFPVFVRMFLEQIAGDQRVAAQRFFAKNYAMFSEQEEAKPLLSSLVSIATKDDLISNKTVCEFWEHKYCITMSDEALQYFFNFLKGDDNLLVLQILSQNMEVSVKTQDTSADDSKTESEPDEIQVTANATEKNKDSPQTDVSLDSLQRITQKIRESPPPLPSIHLYSVTDAHGNPSCITMSPDNELLCASFEDSHIQLWGLSSGILPNVPPNFDNNHLQSVFDFPQYSETKLGQQPEETTNTGTLRGHSDTVFSMSYLNERRYLLSASADKTVRLWDTDTCSNAVCYRGHNYPVFGVDSSPIGSYFASGSFDQTCLLWCSDRNFPLRTFIGHTRSINCVKFHPNGNYLATGSSDMTIRLWCLQDAECKRVLTEHKGMVTALAFSPDGKYLASTGEDHHIKIWDLKTSKVLKDLTGHSQTAYSLVFSPCSSLLASGGHDNIVNIWDVNKVAHSTSNAASGDGTTPPETLGSYSTKQVSIYYLNFSKRNFLQAAGS